MLKVGVDYIFNIWPNEILKFPIEQVLQDVLAANNAFLRAFLPKPLDSVVIVPLRVCWKPPPQPCLKVKFDGAFFKDVNRAEGGVVIWDELG